MMMMNRIKYLYYKMQFIEQLFIFTYLFVNLFWQIVEIARQSAQGGLNWTNRTSNGLVVEIEHSTHLRILEQYKLQLGRSIDYSEIHEILHSISSYEPISTIGREI